MSLPLKVLSTRSKSDKKNTSHRKGAHSTHGPYITETQQRKSVWILATKRDLRFRLLLAFTKTVHSAHLPQSAHTVHARSHARGPWPLPRLQTKWSGLFFLGRGVTRWPICETKMASRSISWPKAHRRHRRRMTILPRPQEDYHHRIILNPTPSLTQLLGEEAKWE